MLFVHVKVIFSHLKWSCWVELVGIILIVCVTKFWSDEMKMLLFSVRWMASFYLKVFVWGSTSHLFSHFCWLDCIIRVFYKLFSWIATLLTIWLCLSSSLRFYLLLEWIHLYLLVTDFLWVASLIVCLFITRTYMHLLIYEFLLVVLLHLTKCRTGLEFNYSFKLFLLRACYSTNLVLLYLLAVLHVCYNRENIISA